MAEGRRVSTRRGRNAINKGGSSGLLSPDPPAEPRGRTRSGWPPRPP
ncbi:hypothetical protein ACP4OV_009714 [Aristida adscensionis]